MIAPALLNPAHNIADFHCGNEELNNWLKEKARKNHILGASRTFVICSPETNKVIGFYCLSMGGIDRATAPGSVRRNMPDPIPVIILGRLAIDVAHQRDGLGAELLRDAVLRANRVAGEVGTRAVLVHAISDEAQAFYLRHGFKLSPIESRTLFLPLT